MLQTGDCSLLFLSILTHAQYSRLPSVPLIQRVVSVRFLARDPCIAATVAKNKNRYTPGVISTITHPFSARRPARDVGAGMGERGKVAAAQGITIHCTQSYTLELLLPGALPALLKEKRGP